MLFLKVTFLGVEVATFFAVRGFSGLRLYLDGEVTETLTYQ